MTPTTICRSTLLMALTAAIAAFPMPSVNASELAGNAVAAPMARATTLRPGDAVSGSLSVTQPMHIVVALKLRNIDQLDQSVASHQRLTASQIALQHAPTPTQAQAVADYLTRSGFKNVTIAPNRMLVSADGNAGSAQAAFLTTFARVRTKEGRIAYANLSDAYIPAALQDNVLSVIGLQTVNKAHILARRLETNASVQAFPVTGHNPTEFSSIYGGTGVPTAAGVTVGIMTQGDLSQTITDLNAFTAANGLPTVSTQTVCTTTDPFGCGFDPSGTVEWDLDSQDIVGMGGGRVGKMIFYNIPSLANTDLVASFNTAMSANEAKIINVSLGECELGALQDGSAAAADQIFKVAAAQGQTFSVATGDEGADNCGNGGIIPSWPANSPYVVAVSGTMLSATTTTWGSEVVWNNLSSRGGATGGSPSTYEPKPVWQNGFAPGTKRGVADVAFDASTYSGARIVLNGGIAQVGGTSLAAPIFAGLWARVIAVKGTTVGFAAPLLYQLPAIDFHDITSGNNNGETATAGYDFASGRGSVILNSAITHIGGTPGDAPPVANFSYTTLGLVANFIDNSTDSDGTIAAHAWTFGDGTRATAANPRHTYAKAGVYSVTETVTDNGGATAAKTRSVTVGQ